MLANKVALITGASRGIGAAVFRAMGDMGAVAVGTATSAEGVRRIAESARAGGFSGRGEIYSAGDSAAAAALVKGAEERHGRLDILVANAGGASDALLLRMRDAEWNRAVDVNLTAPFHLARAALRGMMRRRSGRIVLLSSAAASLGNPGQANYCAAKAGVEGFARAAAREAAARGVTVNAVAPGLVETDMTANLPEAAREMMMKNIPMGRAGSPEEVAAVICFLASDAAAYVTGQTIHVNGGMLM